MKSKSQGEKETYLPQIKCENAVKRIQKPINVVFIASICNIWFATTIFITERFLDYQFFFYIIYTAEYRIIERFIVSSKFLGILYLITY